jgi:phosphoribosylaminoimidazole-succinocarboxamide synthase
LSNNFQGLEGQSAPVFPEDFIDSITNRYVELYEKITGLSFIKSDYGNIDNEIEAAVNKALEAL